MNCKLNAIARPLRKVNGETYYSVIDGSYIGNYVFHNNTERMEFFNFYTNKYQEYVQKQCIVEGNTYEMNIYFDIDIIGDIKNNKKDTDNLNRVLYKTGDLVKNIQTIIKVLKEKLIKDDPFDKKIKFCDLDFICFVTEKPPYVKDGKLKNGYHLHFPMICCYKDTYKALVNDIHAEDEFLKKHLDDISRNNALLYGSSKKLGMDPYLLSSCFYKDRFIDNLNETLNLIITDVCSIKLFDNTKIDINVDNVFQVLPYIFSLRLTDTSLVNYNGNTKAQKKTILYKNIDEISDMDSCSDGEIDCVADSDDRTTTFKNLQEKIDFVKECLSKLDKTRSDNYQDWIRVGFILFNEFEHDQGLRLFKLFSKKSKKYNEHEVVRTFVNLKNRVSQNKLTIGTLRYMMYEDSSPNGIKRIKKKRMIDKIVKRMKNSSGDDDDNDNDNNDDNNNNNNRDADNYDDDSSDDYDNNNNNSEDDIDNDNDNNDINNNDEESDDHNNNNDDDYFGNGDSGGGSGGDSDGGDDVDGDSDFTNSNDDNDFEYCQYTNKPIDYNKLKCIVDNCTTSDVTDYILHYYDDYIYSGTVSCSLNRGEWFKFDKHFYVIEPLPFVNIIERVILSHLENFKNIITTEQPSGNSDIVNYIYNDDGNYADDTTENVAIDDDTNNDGEDKKRKTLLKTIKRCRNMIAMLRFRKEVNNNIEFRLCNPDFIGKLNQEKHLICFKNGVFDMYNNVFRDGTLDDYFTWYIKYDYNVYSEEDDGVKVVRKFLKELFVNENILRYFMDMIKSIFYGMNINKSFIIFSGNGNNGKSLLCKIIEDILGDFCTQLPCGSIMSNNNTNSTGANPFFF